MSNSGRTEAATSHQPNTAGAAPAVPRLLLVDDDEAALRTLEQVLARNGGYELHAIVDPRQALPRFREVQPDAVILDLHMPGLDGFDLIQQLQVRVPEGEYLPILIVSGDMTLESKQRALTLGASDFLAKPFDVPEVHLRVRNLLRIRELTDRLNAQLREQKQRIMGSDVELATRLALIAELCDYRDGAHVQRVGRAAASLATQMGQTAEFVHRIRYAAPLHDIGKTAIPERILLKRDGLTLEEWDVVKTHTTIGARMLAGSRSPVLQMAEEIALYHHENWNGTGYTPGLGGEDIPLAARITAVADVFDALTCERPYKEAWSMHRTVEWIDSMRGTKFDPTVVDALLEVVRTENLTILPETQDDESGPVIELPLLYPLNPGAD
jgi:putative two-component system response regulator